MVYDHCSNAARRCGCGCLPNQSSRADLTADCALLAAASTLAAAEDWMLRKRADAWLAAASPSPSIAQSQSTRQQHDNATAVCRRQCVTRQHTQLYHQPHDHLMSLHLPKQGLQSPRMLVGTTSFFMRHTNCGWSGAINAQGQHKLPVNTAQPCQQPLTTCNRCFTAAQ